MFWLGWASGIVMVRWWGDVASSGRLYCDREVVGCFGGGVVVVCVGEVVGWCFGGGVLMAL